MNNGISGYNAGRNHLYQPVEKRVDASPLTDPSSTRRASGTRDSFASDLSEAEAGMIDRKFPESERMRLRLYGPGRGASTVDPEARGRRLDVRG